MVSSDQRAAGLGVLSTGAFCSRSLSEWKEELKDTVK